MKYSDILRYWRYKILGNSILPWFGILEIQGPVYSDIDIFLANVISWTLYKTPPTYKHLVFIIFSLNSKIVETRFYNNV